MTHQRPDQIADALAHEHSWSRGSSHSHPGAHTWHDHRPHRLNGEFIDLQAEDDARKAAAAAAAAAPNGLMPGGVIDGEALMRAIGGDVGFDDPVDIPAEAPLPPRTITVEPPDGDDWIRMYREAVTHRCQKLLTHPLSMCLDWPCPNTDAAECRMVRERYASNHRGEPWPRCAHHESTQVLATFVGDDKHRRVNMVTLTLGERSLFMVGGPTGFESIYDVDDDVVQRTSQGGWAANTGTPGRYDECVVSAAEMAKAWRALGMPEDLIDTGGREGPERGIE